jgi:hypothetical protein
VRRYEGGKVGAERSETDWSEATAAERARRRARSTWESMKVGRWESRKVGVVTTTLRVRVSGGLPLPAGHRQVERQFVTKVVPAIEKVRG